MGRLLPFGPGKNIGALDTIIAGGNVHALIAEGTPLPANEVMNIVVGSLGTSNPLQYFN
jgi:hypothetical protein